MCCLKTWQHYLWTHKTKVFMDNVSLKCFETQPKASTKQLKWHDNLVLLDMELIHKVRWDNVFPNALNRKEEISSGETFDQDSRSKCHLPREKRHGEEDKGGLHVKLLKWN